MLMRPSLHRFAHILCALIACFSPQASRADLLATNFGASAVRRYDSFTGASLGDFVPSGSGGLVNPQGLVIGPDGNLYVSSFSGHSILRYSGTTATFLGAFVPAGSGGLFKPEGLVFGPDGHLYVASSGSSRVLRYHGTTGAFIDHFVPSGSGGLADARGLSFGPDDHLYVASLSNSSVLRYNGLTGTFIDAFVPSGSGGLLGPRGLTFGPDGNLYVSSQANDRILRYHGTTGAVIDTFVPAGSGGLSTPTGLTFGPDGRLYVTSFDSSSGSASVLRYEAGTGTFVDAFVAAGSGGPGSLNYLTFTPSANQPPVANAGVDRSVACTGLPTTAVTLDGSGSFDPDGSPLTYTWTGPFGTATGVSPTVNLPLGASTITLVVNDGTATSPPDTVDITITVGVQGLLPPLPNRAFKLRSTVPLKLQLFCGATALTNADVAAPEIVNLIREGDAIPLETLDLDAGAANDDGRLFRFSNGNWIFNLGTKGLPAGTFEIVIRTPDGRRFSAGFVLR